MPAYHSSLNEQAGQYRQVGNLVLLPIRTSIRGPAPSPEDQEAQDIIDESIALFRANCLFRNYEIHDCLTKIQAKPTWTLNDANKQLQSAAVDQFALPGDPGFPMNNMYDKPASRQDADALRSYLTQARQECAQRLTAIIYADGKPSKWWLAFTKRKFMGKSTVIDCETDILLTNLQKVFDSFKLLSASVTTVAK